MEGNSRRVTSNQDGPHEKIPELIKRYLEHPFKKPVSEHTKLAFEQVCDWLGDWPTDGSQPLIMDSCCGVGESTQRLGKLFPDAKVIGLDKSRVRTEKHEKVFELPENASIWRADVIDFWRLAVNAGWKLTAHYLLYPNPYPKSVQVQRRWHGSPSFLDILKLGGRLEIRSNWKTYLEEFAIALDVVNIESELNELDVTDPFTAFERKYNASGQANWQLVATLS